jgi:hypothetical protein
VLCGANNYLNYNYVEFTNKHVRLDPYCIDSWIIEPVEQIRRIETDEGIIEGKDLKRGGATSSEFTWRDKQTNKQTAKNLRKDDPQIVPAWHQTPSGCRSSSLHAMAVGVTGD